jgi:hypothetical protein
MDNLRAMAKPENLFRRRYLDRLVKTVGLEHKSPATYQFTLSTQFTKMVNLIAVLSAQSGHRLARNAGRVPVRRRRAVGGDTS